MLHAPPARTAHFNLLCFQVLISLLGSDNAQYGAASGPDLGLTADMAVDIPIPQGLPATFVRHTAYNGSFSVRRFSFVFPSLPNQRYIRRTDAPQMYIFFATSLTML